MVADADEPQDADFEQASSQLNQGLKTCRAVVDSYRAILTGELAANDDHRDGDSTRYGLSTETAANNDAADWGETA